MNRRYFLLAALATAAAQSTAVGAMIFNRARLINTGQEVILESALIDPRDLFRGHYVTLNLSVGDLEKDEIEVDRDFLYNDEVFVELKKGEGIFWTARKLWHAIPADSTGAFIKGKITSIPNANRSRFRISFPFDRFFAPKKRAKELENVRRERGLGVVLSLQPDGSGYIKGITVAGEVIYDEPVF